jgi:hypothetical protein
MEINATLNRETHYIIEQNHLICSSQGSVSFSARYQRKHKISALKDMLSTSTNQDLTNCSEQAPLELVI